jgi:hypothetical protein
MNYQLQNCKRDSGLTVDFFSRRYVQLFVMHGQTLQVHIHAKGD